MDWQLSVIWCTNGVLPLHSPPFRTLSIDRKVGVSQSIYLPGLHAMFLIKWFVANSLCAGGLKIQTMASCMSCWRDTSSGLPLALRLRHVHCTAVCIKYLESFSCRTGLHGNKTITVGCHQIKLFYTFFAACQNQAVNNAAPHIDLSLYSRRHGGEDIYSPFGQSLR